jgi:hypothetical protein
MLPNTLEHRIIPLSARRDRASRLHERTWASLLLVLVIALSTAAYRASVPAASAVGRIGETAPAGLVTSFGERPSHNGRYSAAIVDATPAMVGAEQSWTLHLSRRARHVAHATVVATAWMPEDTVRSPASPSVRYVGGGDYRIDGLSFTKPGWWNVALVIAGKQGRDSVAFNVVVPRAQ